MTPAMVDSLTFAIQNLPPRALFGFVVKHYVAPTLPDVRSDGS